MLLKAQQIIKSRPQPRKGLSAVAPFGTIGKHHTKGSTVTTSVWLVQCQAAFSSPTDLCSVQLFPESFPSFPPTWSHFKSRHWCPKAVGIISKCSCPMLRTQVRGKWVGDQSKRERTQRSRAALRLLPWISGTAKKHIAPPSRSCAGCCSAVGEKGKDGLTKIWCGEDCECPLSFWPPNH